MYLQILQEFSDYIIGFTDAARGAWITLLEDNFDVCKYHANSVVLQIKIVTIFEVWTYY